MAERKLVKGYLEHALIFVLKEFLSPCAENFEKMIELNIEEGLSNGPHIPPMLDGIVNYSKL